MEKLSADAPTTPKKEKEDEKEHKEATPEAST